MRKQSSFLLSATAVRDRFHKLGIYGSGRIWANAWDVFRRMTSRGGRGRRAAVDFVLCFGCGGILFFFFVFFFFERTRPAASLRPPCLIHLSTCNEAVFCLQTKKLLHTGAGVRTGCHYLISLLFRLSVYAKTFVVFTGCDSCTRPIPQTRDPWKRANMG